MYAFVSYQTDDRHVAGQVQQILQGVGIRSFLAHEDIEVSEEWRIRILEELEEADVFVCILSKSYLRSQWCTQEAGIAAYKKRMTVIPLSIDGTVPQAFMGNIQCAKVDSEDLSILDLLPGFVRRNFDAAVSIIVQLIGSSGSYRGAEENFELIMPHLKKMTDDHGRALLRAAMDNNQVYDASLCASEYIPQVYKQFSHTLTLKERRFIKEKCESYGAKF
jgi:hypothetical protein